MAVAIVVLVFFLGVLSTVFMVFQNPLQLGAAIISLACLAGTVYLMRRIKIKIRTVGLYILIIIAGYLLSAAAVNVFMGNIDTGDIRPGGQRDQVAVLLLSPGEIKEYNTQQAVYRLKVLKKTYCNDIKWWNMPVKVYHLKRTVKSIQDNSFSEMNQSLYNKVRESLGEYYSVYNANLLGPPYIEWVMKEIVRAGHTKLVVLCNFLIFEPYRDVIDSKIEKVIRESEGNMEVLYTFPLWNHDAVATLYQNRIIEKTQEDTPEDVGIILLAKGYNDRAYNKYQDAYKREQVFFNKVKENLVKNGYDSRKIKVAYLSYKEPSLRGTVDYLLDSGVKKIVIAAAGFENYNIYTQQALEKIHEDPIVPQHVEVEFIDCWGDSDVLVKALVDRFKMISIN